MYESHEYGDIENVSIASLSARKLENSVHTHIYAFFDA